jgi:hypothetical protein
VSEARDKLEVAIEAIPAVMAGRRSVQMQPLGRFYLIESYSQKFGPYLAECDNLPRGKDWSEAEALDLLAQNEDAVAIYEVCEGRFSDVSWLMAEAWMKKLAESFNPATDTWPAFIQRHISPLSLEEVEADCRNEINWDREHRAAYAGPL